MLPDVRLPATPPRVRLVYNSTLFGPMYLEYSKRLIRVGSCWDNDLVISDASVQSHHCTLLLEEDSVLVLPAETDEKVPVAEAPRVRSGEDVLLGEVRLRVVATRPPAQGEGTK